MFNKERAYIESNAILFQGAAESGADHLEACKKLAEFLKEKGWKINAGAYGPIVKAVEESGADVSTATFQERGKEKYEMKEVSSMEPLDCYKEVKKIDPNNGIIEACYYRLGKMIANSGSYAIFKPDSGTIAHLVPILTVMHKIFTREGTYRKVALIGWTKEEIEAFKNFCLILKVTDNNAWDSEHAWLKNFDLDDIEAVADYLTAREEESLYQR